MNLPGTAIYTIFLAAPPLEQDCSFILDGDIVGVSNHEIGPNVDGLYNIHAYKKNSIPDGPHTLRMDMGPLAPALFKYNYAIYMSNDPDPTASSNVLSVTGDPGSSSSPRLSTSSTEVAPPLKQVSAAVVMIGVVAGVAAVLAVSGSYFFVGLNTGPRSILHQENLKCYEVSVEVMVVVRGLLWSFWVFSSDTSPMIVYRCLPWAIKVPSQSMLVPHFKPYF
ncbi:hypothetical protein FB451DRAFT_1523739 [Mycena latifolia]|nr:hypothetical protein FB451DRAFT_1523739 [Mycena latifolia]